MTCYWGFTLRTHKRMFPHENIREDNSIEISKILLRLPIVCMNDWYDKRMDFAEKLKI